MDINSALEDVREAMARARRYMDAETGAAVFCEVPNHTVGDLLEAFADMDEWLSKGGFLPTDWKR